MPLIFVTGPSGAGKSTVREELSHRGYRAYDTDEDAVAQWRNRTTGVITPLLAEAHRTPEFIAENDWWADPDRVRELAEGAQQFVFLCGSVGNDAEIWPFFDQVFVLSIDEATMRERLLTRTAHDFGTRPHELELLLVWRAVSVDHYLRSGAVVVDAMRPPGVVVDEILLALAVPG